MTGWSASALLLFGVAFGPHGLDVLSPAVLDFFDPGSAMGLAMIGVFVGLGVEPRRLVTSGLAVASMLRCAAVMAPVAFAVIATLQYFGGLSGPWWLGAIILALCAAVAESTADPSIDDLLMIVAAALVLAALRGSGATAAALMIGALAGIAALVAVAAWLLVAQTDVEAEQHVFVVGALLLIGGAAAYLGLSETYAGLAAGVVWNVAASVGKARIIRDLAYFQHALVVLVLVVAGARATLSIETCALAAVVIAARAMGRAVGTWITARWSSNHTHGDTPIAGLVGLAIALDAFRSMPGDALGGTIVGVIVIATTGMNALGMFAHPPAHRSSFQIAGAGAPDA